MLQTKTLDNNKDALLNTIESCADFAAWLQKKAEESGIKLKEYSVGRSVELIYDDAPEWRKKNCNNAEVINVGTSDDELNKNIQQEPVLYDYILPFACPIVKFDLYYTANYGDCLRVFAEDIPGLFYSEKIMWEIAEVAYKVEITFDARKWKFAAGLWIHKLLCDDASTIATSENETLIRLLAAKFSYITLNQLLDLWETALLPEEPTLFATWLMGENNFKCRKQAVLPGF